MVALIIYTSDFHFLIISVACGLSWLSWYFLQASSDSAANSVPNSQDGNLSGSVHLFKLSYWYQFLAGQWVGRLLCKCHALVQSHVQGFGGNLMYTVWLLSLTMCGQSVSQFPTEEKMGHRHHKTYIGLRHVERCSKSLIIKEMPQWDIISHLSEWLPSINQRTTSVSEYVEKREPSLIHCWWDCKLV